MAVSHTSNVFYKLFFIGLLFAHSVQATFLDRHAEGWHWYEDRVSEEEEMKEDTPKPEKKPEIKEEASSDTQQLEALQKELKRRRDRAVMRPTYAHVKDYQLLQKWMVDHANQFSNMWMKVLYTTPELDTTLENPMAQSARHVYLDEREKNLEAKVKSLSKEYGLFFFFKKNCPYCHHFAPIVKQFSERFGWKVLAISLDGGTLDAFPQAQMDNGAAAKLGVTQVPALMAVNPTTGHVLPLSIGMTTQDAILERIQILTDRSLR